jgi:hypothetical protein
MRSLASKLALVSLLVLAGVGLEAFSTAPPGDKEPQKPQDLPCGGKTLKCDPGQTPVCSKDGTPECWAPESVPKSRAEYEAALLTKVMKRTITTAEVEKEEYQAILKAGRYKNEKEKIDVTFSPLPK